MSSMPAMNNEGRCATRHIKIPTLTIVQILVIISSTMLSEVSPNTAFDV